MGDLDPHPRRDGGRARLLRRELETASAATCRRDAARGDHGRRVRAWRPQPHRAERRKFDDETEERRASGSMKRFEKIGTAADEPHPRQRRLRRRPDRVRAARSRTSARWRRRSSARRTSPRTNFIAAQQGRGRDGSPTAVIEKQEMYGDDLDRLLDAQHLAASPRSTGRRRRRGRRSDERRIARAGLSLRRSPRRADARTGWRVPLRLRALGAVLALALVGVVVYAGRSISPGPAWSSWKPSGGGLGAAKQIADARRAAGTACRAATSSST